MIMVDHTLYPTDSSPVVFAAFLREGPFTLVSASPQRQERRLGTSHLRGAGFGFSLDKDWFMIRLERCLLLLLCIRSAHLEILEFRMCGAY